MKLLIFGFAFTFTLIAQLSAQTTIDKIIATRHDEYENNAWKCKDSSVITYNLEGFKLGTLSSKNDANSVWNNFTKVTFTLSSTNKITSELRENWNGTSWVNTNKYTYSFDANDNKTLILYEVWSGTTWNEVGKIEYSGYNTFGGYGQENYFNKINGSWKNLSYRTRSYVNASSKLEIDSKFVWDNITSSWKKNERLTYTYNQDSIGTIIKSVLDTSNSNWINATKEIRTYAFNPQRITEYRTQTWTNPDSIIRWINAARTLTYYNNNYKIDHSISDVALSETAWENQFQDQYFYGTQDSLSEYYNQWLINGVWENYKRKTYFYNGNNLAEEKNFAGNGTNWNEVSNTNFNYDIKNNRIFQQKDSLLNGSFQSYSRDFFYYGTFPLINLNTLQSIQKTVVYPNPTNSNLHIKLNASENFVAQITISDIVGKTRILIIQPIFIGSNDFNIISTNLETGNYILSITDDSNNAFHQKIQVVK